MARFEYEYGTDHFLTPWFAATGRSCVGHCHFGQTRAATRTTRDTQPASGEEAEETASDSDDSGIEPAAEAVQDLPTASAGTKKGPRCEALQAANSAKHTAWLHGCKSYTACLPTGSKVILK